MADHHQSNVFRLFKPDRFERLSRSIGRPIATYWRLLIFPASSWTRARNYRIFSSGGGEQKHRPTPKNAASFNLAMGPRDIGYAWHALDCTIRTAVDPSERILMKGFGIFF